MGWGLSSRSSVEILAREGGGAEPGKAEGVYRELVEDRRGEGSVSVVMKSSEGGVGGGLFLAALLCKPPQLPVRLQNTKILK